MHSIQIFDSVALILQLMYKYVGNEITTTQSTYKEIIPTVKAAPVLIIVSKYGIQNADKIDIVGKLKLPRNNGPIAPLETWGPLISQTETIAVPNIAGNALTIPPSTGSKYER